MSSPSGTLYPSESVYPGADGGDDGGGGGGGIITTTQFPSNTLFPSDTTWPGEGDAPAPASQNRIRWNKLSDKTIQTGLDRGVLYLLDGPAVPWNGLTSVDEKGGDSATPFYMDGRPFVYFSKPKEFGATLNAMTYPDEFSKVMGIVEVADGMYLDSQMGDSFHLSYRTKIFDATGSESAYKIHLIYNAFVVPPDVTYASITSEVNPTDFSWDIQAVPIQFQGFRPTAHVILDTRHLDPDKLHMLEAILYGTGNTLPRMPEPQTLQDLLGFGDAIVITDNGDGTWTAEGSYQNITVDDITGVFQITNVDAIDNGDGTYAISSTNV